ncbi:hypothetical protein K458DRAFT_447676 [Lentithecium fluviatile CBS 122367]|uniref:FAD-binding FR-type domain-containing protein n=1 Tax=Lentithecium fluviatile CBS 122367 TaxID=1168545 RepID=A0A6G1IDT4_9PLEO|nr:hypothetical protein K458DRAFT_447676 [Lentithecium fluviatile CBS 122367]
MVLGYEFVTLDDNQKSERRSLLNHYSFVAQWSALIILAWCLLRLFLSKVAQYGQKNERPRSPSFKKQLDGQWAWLAKARERWDRTIWWMKKDVLPDWGTRAEWFVAGAWTTWLLYLCIVNTGNDYLHLTKRFGAIGASQLPLHYLLAMRSPYSPIQWVTRLSHEELKMSHQILGRIVFVLFALHGAFYLNFFILSGFLAKRIWDRDVIFGLTSIILFSTISTTSFARLRRWNYRLFYWCHITIAITSVIPLYLHVHHIRLYVWEIVAVNSLNWVLRATCTKTYFGNIKLLPGTDLVQIRIPLTSMNSALSWQPGQHIYLGQPSRYLYSESKRDKTIALRGFSNPFTIASIPVKDKELLLVARALSGNTKTFADLARSLANETLDIPILLEGPYGASTHFPDFSTFDKILLVAGGVGATFVMPVYRSIIDFHDPNRAGHPQIRFIWAVQKLADTQWAFPNFADEDGSDSDSEPHDSNAVEVFVTGGLGAAVHIDEPGEDIELAESDQLLSLEDEMKKPRKGMVLRTGRPRIPAVVDDMFSKGSRIAVISCGPKRMTRKLSASVEQWVQQGYEVYYHQETFGW